MKRFIIVLTAVFLFFSIVNLRSHSEEEKMKGTISLSGAWALYPMAVRWAEEFQKTYPDIKIDIAAGGAGKGMADCLAEIVDIGMVSREIYPEEVQKGAWWISVTKDAVVPTVNRNNPVLADLLSKGVKKDIFISIWVSEKITTWGQVAGNNNRKTINVYTRSDACGAADTWALYLDARQEDLLGIGVYGDPGLAEAVRKDVLGIGFNNINFVYDAKTKKQVENIKVLPVDINENGHIDDDEDFYDNRDDITGAIAEGKYPSPPARDLHFVLHGKPKKAIVTAFLKWVLTEGQKYVPEGGYINLSKEKIEQQIKKLESE
ncbi:MAG: PstS family phosphate ABC transporter substrate-binding protein [Candidatus Aureabacteria bacterium]|nr:PstS family phosphate ABC transporter substrate-binding protein [Candidatus Auribacterota bacterium]